MRLTSCTPLQVPVIPVVFHRYTGVEGWFQSTFRRAVWGSRFQAKVLAPISTTGMLSDDAATLAQHAHTVVQQAVLSMESHLHRD